MTPGPPSFPITYYAPQAGIVRDYADADDLALELRDFDTDRVQGPGSRWLVDAAGRRVRVRISGATVQLLEVMPGRPPLQSTLAAMREQALQHEENRDPMVRGAVMGARIAGWIVLPLVVLSVAMNFYDWGRAAGPVSFTWDQPIVAVIAIGAAGMFASQWGARRYILPAMVLVCVGAVTLGTLRGWALLGAGFGVTGAGGYFQLALEWLLGLLFPGALFAITAVLLVVYGRTYAALRARRRSARPAG